MKRNMVKRNSSLLSLLINMVCTCFVKFSSLKLCFNHQISCTFNVMTFAFISILLQILKLVQESACHLSVLSPKCASKHNSIDDFFPIRCTHMLYNLYQMKNFLHFDTNFEDPVYDTN